MTYLPHLQEHVEQLAAALGVTLNTHVVVRGDGGVSSFLANAPLRFHWSLSIGGMMVGFSTGEVPHGEGEIAFYEAISKDLLASVVDGRLKKAREAAKQDAQFWTRKATG